MLQKIERIPFEEKFYTEYEMLIFRTVDDTSPYVFPHIQDLTNEAIITIHDEETHISIAEAVERKDYEIYGMSKAAFIKAAHDYRLAHFEPNLTEKREIGYHVLSFLAKNNISFTNMSGDIIHCPIVGDVW